MSVYSLDKEDRKSIDDIFANVDQLHVVGEFRKKLDEVSDAVCDELTNYLQDEYTIRLEDIVLRKAKKVVEGILRGEDLKSFGLAPDTVWHSPDKLTSYDFAGVRNAIVTQFKAEIQHAEIIKLREENGQLEKDLKYLRDRDRDRY